MRSNTLRLPCSDYLLIDINDYRAPVNRIIINDLMSKNHGKFLERNNLVREGRNTVLQLSKLKGF